MKGSRRSATAAPRRATVPCLRGTPEQRLSIAVLCNLGDIDPGELSHRIADLYLTGKKAAAPAPATVELPAAEIAARAGLYRNRRTGKILGMKVEEGKLRTRGGRTVSPLSTSLLPGGQRRPSSNLCRTACASSPSTATPFPMNGWRRPLRPRPNSPKYAGEYVSDEAEVTYKVVMEEGKLVVQEAVRTPRSR